MSVSVPATLYAQSGIVHRIRGVERGICSRAALHGEPLGQQLHPFADPRDTQFGSTGFARNKLDPDSNNSQPVVTACPRAHRSLAIQQHDRTAPHADAHECGSPRKAVWLA